MKGLPKRGLTSALVACTLFVAVMGLSCFWLSDGQVLLGPDSILKLPVLSHWRNCPTHFTSAFTVFSDGQYRPLSYALIACVRAFVPLDQVRVWQLWFLGWHALNSLLLFSVARNLLKSDCGALAAAALFAVHPLGAHLTQPARHFHYLLGLALSLGALRCYMWAASNCDGDGASEERAVRLLPLALACALFVMGLLTVKAALAVLMAAVAYDLASHTRPVHLAVKWALLVALATPILAVWAIVSAPPLTYRYPALPGESWLPSFVSAVGGMGHYSAGLLWGAGIPACLEEIVRKRNVISDANVLWPLAITAALTCGAALSLAYARRLRDGRTATAGILTTVDLAVGWSLGALAPFMSMAWDRVTDYVSWEYLYFPLAGLCLIVGSVVAGAMRCRRPIRLAAGAAFVLWLTALAGTHVCLGSAARSPVTYWKHVHGLNPRSARASTRLGTAYVRAGDLQSGIRHLFSPVLSNLRDSCLTMAGHYLSRGELLAAAVHCYAAVAPHVGLQCQGVEPHLATILARAGLLDHAESVWGEVLNANPFHTDGLCSLARIWQAKGFLRAAKQYLTRARDIAPHGPAPGRPHDRIDPSCPTALPPLDEVRFLTSSKAHGTALSRLTAIARQHPDDPVLALWAAKAELGMGRVATATARVKAVEPRLKAWHQFWAIKSYVQVAAGRYSEAAACAERAIELGSHDAGAYCIAGTGLMAQGESSEAVRLLQAAVEANAKWPEARLNLASVLALQGRLDEAIQHLLAAMQLEPRRARAHVELGKLARRGGNVQEAVQRFRRAVELEPRSAACHRHLASALHETGQTAEAAKHLRIADGLVARPE